MNVAVWHKTDQKDKLHPIYVCEIYSVADVGSGGVFLKKKTYLLDVFVWPHPPSEASRGLRGHVQQDDEA